MDVGAGPLTYLGKKREGRRINITAVDPLADAYDRMLDKYHVQPITRTQRLDAESLTTRFPSNTFDLVFAHNSIDHARNPETAILQMIDVVKSDQFVLLEHRVNEAERQGHFGLHQWDFSVSADGDFLVSSGSVRVNMTRKAAGLCTTTCHLYDDGTWLVVRMRKRVHNDAT